MLLSNLFLPVPSELVLPFAGFLVGRGFFSFPVLMLAATAGSLIGALAVYAPAHRLGEEPARRFIKRYGRFVLLSESDLDKASEWFDRPARCHGRPETQPARLLRGRYKS
jgi:membrane protein DedA with SNARE-associated domain